MPFEQWLQSKGFDASTLGDGQMATLRVAWKVETSPPPVAAVVATTAATPSPQLAPPPTPAATSFDDKMRAIEEESARVEYIREATARVAERYVGNNERIRTLREMCEAAVADKKTDARAYDLALLRFDRFEGTILVSPGQPQATDEVVEAAICKMGKLGSLESSFGERTLDAADRAFRHGLGLHELIGMAARQRGWRGGDVRRDLRSAMRFAFGDGPMSSGVSGPSTISTPGILSNVANKFLRDSWNAVERSWREVTAVRSVNDFKTITTYSLTGDLTYEKVAPGGEIKHGTLGEETYSNRADTYGKLISLDRRDVINDDLGAFINVAKRLGRGGALKLNDVFWTEFMADASTFYTAARGNYDDGTDTAFGNDGLTAADVIWQAKTDPDGKPLGLMAKILLVPPGHRVPALRLMSSQFFGTTGEEGEQNPWAGMFKVVSSVYLANSSYTGYSALAWYMLADPNELPVIETAFLNGREEPVVEDVEVAADHLGLGMRAYHDFGCNKQEYRAALKLKGEA